MKKFIILSLVTMIMFSSSIIAKATEDEPERVYSYFTTEDILFLIIKPKLDKIVKDQYGKEMLVNPMKVQDVAVMRKGKFDKDNPNIDSWIEVRMSMMVGERKPKENFKMDTVVLKIDAPNIGGNANKPHLANGKIDGIQVDLVEYYKNK